MQVIRPVGREAAAKKYDVLSALMALALSADPHRQRLILRFLSLVTTRYNWQRNELAMGQREIARLWCVDERTVKREMARLRADGWVEVRRQGARGRVAVLAFAWERIMADTRVVWDNIGPDFVERAGGTCAEAAMLPETTVVPFRRPAEIAREGLWGAASAKLMVEDAALFSAWFAALADAGVHSGCLHLIAPTRFQARYIRTHLLARLQHAVEAVDASVCGVEVRDI